MRIFVSWSGSQSKYIATALREWLPMVFHAAKPYMSDKDIEAGARWSNVIAAELETSDFGIVCLTPDNLNSRWLHFEAGALSKSVAESHVVPLLYNLTPTDVQPPLGQFQMKALDRAGIESILSAMNDSVEIAHRLTPEVLAGTFNGMWPALEEKIKAVPDAPQVGPPPRGDRELLEEILSIVRSRNRLGTWVSAPVTPETIYMDADIGTDAAGSYRSLAAALPAESNPLMAELRALVGPDGIVKVTGKGLEIRTPVPLLKERKFRITELLRSTGLAVDFTSDKQRPAQPEPE